MTSTLTRGPSGASAHLRGDGFADFEVGAFSNSIFGPGRVILPGPIFTDGFESGNFAWSVTQP